MKKKIVVFGSKGFIANSFKESPLTEDEFKIIMLGKDKYNILKKKNFKKISTLLDKNTTVLFTSTIAPSKTFNDFVTNIQMALNLKKIVNNKKVKNFIYISSDAVYTDTKKKN
jgi:UDP-glucose 4-epimerase